MATPMLSGHGAGMSDYLTNLLFRTRHPECTIQPRLSSMFDSASLGSEVGGWGPEEASHPVSGVNEWLPRHASSARQSPAGMGQSQEGPKLIRERETQQRERGLESTAGFERRDSSSETIFLSEPKDVALETTPVLSQVRTKPGDDGGKPSRHPVIPLPENSKVQTGHANSQEIAVRRDEVTTQTAPSSLDDEQRWATSRRNPSENKAVSLSPIDRSIVAGSTPITSTGPGQEGTVPLHKPATQFASPPLRVPSDEANGAGRGEASALITEPPSGKGLTPSIVTVSPARDRRPDNHVAARGTQVKASLSPRPLVGPPSALGDGESEPQQRLSAAVSESERYTPTSRRAVASDMPDLSEITLDSSLVFSAPATMMNRAAPQGMSHKAANQPVTPSSPEDMKEQAVSSLAVPMSTKTFMAARRLAGPMAADTAGRAMAADRVKPAEPTVQVTIGRVEVRAVAPPVRQEKGRKPQSAMSLDDYLKRRGGRSGG